MSFFTWSWRESLLVIPLGLIVLGTIFGNLLVLYSAFHNRSQTLWLPTHYFIANLSLADFLVGVLCLPFLATLQLTGNWYFGPVYCEIWTVTHFWLCSASILSTCAVCIERYVGVRHPLQHKDIMNGRRIGGMIAGVWVIAGFLTLTSLYVWPQPKSEDPLVCPINQQIGHVIVAVVGILYIPAAIMIILYGRIYVIATRHLKSLKRKSVPATKKKLIPHSISADTSTAETSETSLSVSRPSDDKLAEAETGSGEKKEKVEKNSQKSKQINLAKRLSVLVGILLASYLPFFTLYLVMAFHPGSVDQRVFSFFGWIRYFNSCINPVIYAFAVPAYRKAMKEVALRAVGRK